MCVPASMEADRKLQHIFDVSYLTADPFSLDFRDSAYYRLWMASQHVVGPILR